jgi:ZIP family zinc transporter
LRQLSVLVCTRARFFGLSSRGEGTDRAEMLRRIAIGFGLLSLVWFASRVRQRRAEGLSTRDVAVGTAVGLGLHNLSEGLAIGQSAATGATAFALILVIGFALHNATEGFGIVGPLGAIRPSWGWLGLAGLVGGGPTFLGTMLGYQVHSSELELCFYALAGGALLYIIGEIWIGTRRHGHRTLGLFLLSAGFLAGVATDLVVAYGGG